MNAPEESVQTTSENAKQQLVPQPSYGVFAWAGILVLSVFSGQTFLIQILFGVVAVSACIWWHIVSRKRVRRDNLLRRILDYIAFGFGSGMFLSASFIILLGLVHKISAIRTAISFSICIIIAVGLIAGAYHLVFQRSKSVTQN